MRIKNMASSQTRAPNSYLELVRRFPLASIRSDQQLSAAQATLDGLLARGKLDRGEEMYLEALSDLVATYEDEHHPIPAATDADMLRSLLEDKGVTQADLHRDTGIAKSTISEVLAGKRPFSRQMIRKLAEFFQIDVSVLVANL
jgi:HTH-type transcriptional regulator / antitoxin HigA